MKQAWINFINTPELLSNFIAILYMKTNRYDNEQVKNCYSLVSTCFSSISARNKGLLASFDYGLLLRGMKIVL